VVDAQTRLPVTGASIMAGGPCVALQDKPPSTESDEDGWFELTLPEGTCGISVTYQFAQVVREGLEVRSDAPLTEAIALDHDSVVLRDGISKACPRTQRAPAANIGSTPEDADGIARAVLSRFAEYRNTLSGGVEPPGKVDVVMELVRPQLTLASSVLPRSTREQFAPRSLQDLREQAKRPKRERARMLRFISIDSDGDCALVVVGRGFSFDTDVFERRDREWVFVRRVGGFVLD
jgi:hypothetical protein